MLAKCTNASCSAEFRYLDEGKLFRLEIDPNARPPNAKAAEYFWLCSRCSAAMTLRLAQDGRVMAARLQEAVDTDSHVAFISVNRESGLLLLAVFAAAHSERHMRVRHKDAMPQTLEHRDEIVAAASSCPAPDCSSLVIEYRPADSVRPGHPEDWEFTCPRCGVEFTVTQGELIFQSVPKQWLSTNVHAVAGLD